MNEIEKKFYDAFIADPFGGSPDDLRYGEIIGPYKVDFIYEERFVIEIDGHEAHKTKEQRDYDYKRERYLMKNKFIVVRFTGTEVFLDVSRCIEDFLEIVVGFEIQEIEMKEEYFDKGIKITSAKKESQQ